MSDLAQFRADTRAWLEENCPPSMREPVRSDKDATWGGRNATYANPDQKIWLDRMAARGWTVPDWPTAYGGGGLSPAEAEWAVRRLAELLDWSQPAVFSSSP